MKEEQAPRDINELLSNAVATYNAMTPVEKALHDAAQRRSFVRGQCGLNPGPDVLAEEVLRLRSTLKEAEKALEAADMAILGSAPYNAICDDLTEHACNRIRTALALIRSGGE